MTILLLFGVCVLGTIKVMLQSAFAERSVINNADATLFNGAVFVFAFAAFSYKLFPIDVPSVVFGAIIGFFTVCFQLLYTKALSYGDVSISVMTVNLSLIIPTAFSLIFYGDKLTFLRAAGIILALTAVVISAEREGDIDGQNDTEKNGNDKKRLVLSIAACFIAGLESVMKKLFVKGDFSESNDGFIPWAYLFAALFSAILFFAENKKGLRLSFRPGVRMILFACGEGVALGIYQFVYVIAIKNIDGSVYYPASNGGLMVFCALSGWLILRDKIKRRQLVSVAIAVVAVVLLCIKQN